MPDIVPRCRVNVPFTKEQIKATFRGCDRDRDGRLSKEELNAGFQRLGSHLPCWRAWWALHRADANGDGYIGEGELDDLVKYAFKQGYEVK
ncbi:hypothetical protein AAG906_030442 [Vitis piasezkii]